MSIRRDVVSGDEGFTLIEVLMALVIFAVAGIVFVLGVGTAVQSSDRHRKEATVQTILRNQAEGLYVAAASCATSGSPIGYTPTTVPGYTIGITYAAPSGVAAAANCPAAGSYLTATVTAQSTDARSAASTVTVVLRAP